ncbi:MAG: cytochrome C oxidase subunit IV family protein [Chloroflexi bacterium]|nr:cytochrome C oxidase subunit IV family protein [Chloroflexota bacterium]
MAQQTESITGHHPTFKQYVLIAIILFAITIVEFLLIWDKAGISDDLGASKIPLLIGLSVIKFYTVIMFYMHLRFDSKLFTIIFIGGLGLAFMVGLALLGLFTAINGDQRSYAADRATPYQEHAEAETKAESATSAPVAAGPVAFEVGAAGDDLAFDTTSLSVNSGAEVTVTFSNPAARNSHNFVIVQNGTKDAVAADGTAAGPDNNWVPPGDPRVIANTVLIGPGESAKVTFTAPAPGIYQFVCTFPGHNFTMFGDFVVTEGAEAATAPATVGSTETSERAPSGPVSVALGAAGETLTFDTTSLSADSGAEVTVTFSNPSSANTHNFVLVQDGTKDAVAGDGINFPDNNWVKPGDSRVIANTVLIGPGETAKVTFTAPAPGAYQFVCTFPGHNFTMFGDFVVN